MWHLLEKISEQVTKYSTVLGQLWYLCVFVFRLIVVVTIGGAVYGDEQSAFKCSTQEPGCTNMCFNDFSKISHIRFWAFQLLGVAIPVVLFHFYSMNVTGQIEKLRKDEAAIKAEDGELMDLLVPLTNRIHYAYFLSIIARLVIEAIFMYLAYELFQFMDMSAQYENGPLDFIWTRVPAMFSCKGTSPEVTAACHQAIGMNKLGHVPCWVSRPWEKTIFIRYMNVLSALCFVLCALELIYLTLKGLMNRVDRRRQIPKFSANGHPRNGYPMNGHPMNGRRQDSVFYASAPDAYRLENETNYPSLAVPVKFDRRYESTKMSMKQNGLGKKVRISDEGEITDDIDLMSNASAKN